MTSVAVVAHAGKTLGDGLPELRRVLADAGVGDPIWYEVSKSKYAPKCVQRALGDGADLLLVWGGDGMVQRSIDAVNARPPSHFKTSAARYGRTPEPTLAIASCGVAREIQT